MAGDPMELDSAQEAQEAGANENNMAAATGATTTWFAPPLSSESQEQPADDDPMEVSDDEGTDDDDDDDGQRLQPNRMNHDDLLLLEAVVESNIHRLTMMLGLLERAFDRDLQAAVDLLRQEEAAHGGGFGAVPASTEAIAGLEKQTFRAAMGDGGRGAGATECTICCEELEDGQEISVVPCPGAHGFHSHCIGKWLGQYSNMCPLCRHALPTAVNVH